MKMKKIIALVLIAVMAAAAMTSCGKKKNQPETEQIVTNETPSDKKDIEQEKSDEPKVKEEEKKDVEQKKEEKKAEEKVSGKKEDKAPEKNEEEKKEFTPTFMYFVSGKDEGFDATNVTIDELKKEYNQKVNFDIRNIDEDPELVKNFPVGDGNTPTLIMLNTKNEISNILFKTADKEKLKQAIEAALK